jgi:hypothetical protein
VHPNPYKLPDLTGLTNSFRNRTVCNGYSQAAQPARVEKMGRVTCFVCALIVRACTRFATDGVLAYCLPSVPSLLELRHSDWRPGQGVRSGPDSFFSSGHSQPNGIGCRGPSHFNVRRRIRRK